MPVLSPTKVESKPRLASGGGGGQGFGERGDRGRGDFDSMATAERYRLGMWFALASITMLFIALTSAYIVRQGLSNDWQPIATPPILWLTTTILLASSLTLEAARRALRRGLLSVFSRWLMVTAAAGVLFLVGQVVAWRQLAAQGLFLATTPHSSFFYLLTGTHGLHLLGGLVALVFVVSGALRLRYSAHQRTAVDVTALYWHFMDGLWIYLFVLLFAWR